MNEVVSSKGRQRKLAIATRYVQSKGKLQTALTPVNLKDLMNAIFALHPEIKPPQKITRRTLWDAFFQIYASLELGKNFGVPARKPKFSTKPRRDDKFYISREWRELRYQAIKQYGARCQCCGASPSTGAVMHVDHIKPRSKFPALQLDITNLQVLCADCNMGKSNKDDTDWRESFDQEQVAHLRLIVGGK